ncbi:hypothetical protein CCACVL1_29106 [Corchorus capsularis]|uniref:Uncharacterized protein n=1 Tax=Corchorus capsularis TaxID=210143 RepID=A0A1R3G3S2_COCAP|nr:hypothetical protein CCACVL1_29106 [Corchorus capsularis]
MRQDVRKRKAIDVALEGSARGGRKETMMKRQSHIRKEGTQGSSDGNFIFEVENGER